MASLHATDSKQFPTKDLEEVEQELNKPTCHLELE